MLKPLHQASVNLFKEQVLEQDLVEEDSQVEADNLVVLAALVAFLRKSLEVEVLAGI